MLRKVKEGDIVRLSGDSADLWIQDYNVRVSSLARVERTPGPFDRKVLVTIDSIDGDKNVCTTVRRSKLLPCAEATCKERIICDVYIKHCSVKDMYGESEEDRQCEFFAVNDMYGWLYSQGILKEVCFEFKDYDEGTFFAMDAVELETYRAKMEAANTYNTELATRLIFEEKATPCTYSGAICLTWPMDTYRNVDGCVGRSWECALAQLQNVATISAIAEVQRKEGPKEAVRELFRRHCWKPAPEHAKE